MSKNKVINLIPNLMANECDIAGCKNDVVLHCPECDLNVCKDHARNGRCIYCTKEGIVINTEVIDKIQAILNK